MNIRPKQLFLVDALGAVVTALLLYFVLPRFESAFGMPKPTLYALSAVAVVFAVYSFCCHLFLRKNWRPFLFVIAAANLLYCIATLILMQYHSAQLTGLGIAYFAGEMAIIGFLVFLELKAARANQGHAFGEQTKG